MYNIGDLIFYSKTGVCEVLEITEMESAAFGGVKSYYILKPLYQECNISIPVDNDKVYMRPILSKEMVHELIDEIPHIEVKAYYSQNLNQLKNHYKEIMDSHSSKAMIELTLSVNKKRQEAEENKRKLGAVDERFLKEAEELLFGEFAAVLDIPRNQVKAYIADRIGDIN